MTRSVVNPQSVGGICKSDAESGRSLRVIAFGPCVADRDLKCVELEGCDEANLARPRHMADAVAYGVFKEWLQQKLRYEGTRGLGLDVVVERQTVAEPELFYPEVQIRILQFFGERSHLAAGILERVAQKISKRDHHSPS